VAEELASRDHLVFACGRYEGIDARVAAHYATSHEVREVSIGDYVLAGGEAATLVMCEAIVRLLPGVLGNPQSAVDDSFSRPDALLEGPVFTGRRCGAGCRCPRSCCPAITPGCRRGATSRRAAGPTIPR
jgi:tRNA (guanine37-N1)-methyltransferase